MDWIENWTDQSGWKTRGGDFFFYSAYMNTQQLISDPSMSMLESEEIGVINVIPDDHYSNSIFLNSTDQESCETGQQE